MELEELREQLAQLKSTLAKQQIISERAIREATQQGLAKINRAGRIYIIFALFALYYCCSLLYKMGFSNGFVLLTGIVLLFFAVGMIYMHYGLMSADLRQGNLVETASKLTRFRRMYSRWHLISVPILLVWIYLFYGESSILSDNPEYALIGMIAGGTIGGAIGLYRHFKTLAEADRTLSHLKELLHDEQ